jgi:pseudaminic acid cytidylyltransferase
MARLAIIPARGGSKRIPGKNIKPFLGKPIIAYSIEAALNSKLFDEVMVSTDHPETAEIAKLYGASVPFLRSADNSNDFASTFDVIEEVVESYLQIDKTFDQICCIYATAPLVEVTTLKEALMLLESENFDCVFPAIAFSSPIQRAFKKHPNSRMQMLQEENLNSRSQDLERTYHDAGQFYWMVYDKVKNGRKLWTANTGIIEIDESLGQDIDTQSDWALAELKYQLFDQARKKK